MQRDLSRDREQSGVITWPSSTEINDARFALPTTRVITQNPSLIPRALVEVAAEGDHAERAR